MFTTFGLPLSITSDQGPQIVSREFKDYLKDNGIEQHLSTPYYPQRNGEVERQNRSLLKAIKTAQIEKGDWKKEIDTYLLAYRTTPHTVTNMSPAELMFSRKLRTKLPYLPDTETDKIGVEDRDSLEKEKGKQYADMKRGAVPSDIVRGDRVLLEQRHKDKLSTWFETEPYTVTNKYGNQVILKPGDDRNGHIKRNITHVKKYQEADTNGRENGDQSHADTSADNAVAEPVVRPKRETRPPKYLEYYFT